MKIEKKLYLKSPVGVRTYPLDVMFSFLGIPTSLLSLAGIAEPYSITTLLPDGINKVWSVILFIGCLAWFIGVMSTSETHSGNVIVVRRVPITIFGLWLVSSACFVYGCALLLIAGWVSLTAAITMFVFAFGTTMRRIKLQIND